MKKYDFDRVISRKKTDSVKWSHYPDEVLPLWVADMDFPSPPEVALAIQERISHPFFGYAGDNKPLIEAICKWVSLRHGWKVQPDWILLMSGVVTGINWVAQTFLHPGESLCFHTPVYPPFFYIPENAGVSRIEIPMVVRDSQYEIDFEKFENSLEPSTKLFVLCNPHNPVGRVFTRQELERINEICLRRGVLVCSDEIHCDLTFSGYRHIPLASLSEEAAQNTVTLMAPSKTFNLPGLHFSFAIVPNKSHREQMEKARKGVIGCPNILANESTLAVLTYSADWLDQLLIYLESNRDFMLDFLKTHIPGILMTQPEGTYLAWLDCRELDLMPDPYRLFLNNAKVALNDGRAFGKNGSGFVRLNFGCPRPILTDALVRMADAVSSG
ncbi:MAG: pyridoxal phosphate-dependent aminotransferase [Anaerolineaceae bacterium]|nr:pyridoxal phosphate-dependent aminotransferase [Anaerolineaceae bacterium]